MTTFEQAYLKKIRVGGRGMGGNSSSVWLIETSTTSSFQKGYQDSSMTSFKEMLIGVQTLTGWNLGLSI